jgi:ankyrin repeat protein
LALHAGTGLPFVILLFMKKIILFVGLLLVSSSLFSQKLYRAVESNDYAEAENLLKAGAKVNAYAKNGLLPLWRASADNRPELVRLLIQYGAEVDRRIKVSPGGGSSLEMACQEGHLEVVQILVDNGANVNDRGFLGFTPIRVAARNGHLEIVKYLAEKGAEIDARADDKATPLEHAAAKGHYEIVEYLLGKGANLNNKDKDGDFPLGEAAKYGHEEIAKLLLKKGADAGLTNKEGLTAYLLAKRHGQAKIVKLLESHRAH